MEDDVMLWEYAGFTNTSDITLVSRFSGQLLYYKLVLELVWMCQSDAGYGCLQTMILSLCGSQDFCNFSEVN